MTNLCSFFPPPNFLFRPTFINGDKGGIRLEDYNGSVLSTRKVPEVVGAKRKGPAEERRNSGAKRRK